MTEREEYNTIIFINIYIFIHRIGRKYKEKIEKKHING